EIEDKEVAYHLQEALIRRLVEAELPLELLDQLGRDALGAAILRLPRRLKLRLSAAGQLAAGAGDAFQGTTRLPLDLRDHLLDRTAGRRLDDHEIDHHDPEQCGDHEQQTANDIGEHDGVRMSSNAAHSVT